MSSTIVVRDVINQVDSQGIGSKMEDELRFQMKVMLAIGRHDTWIKKIQKLEEECD